MKGLDGKQMPHQYSVRLLVLSFSNLPGTAELSNLAIKSVFFAAFVNRSGPFLVTLRLKYGRLTRPKTPSATMTTQRRAGT
jgi:hypothetical protein